MLKRVAVVIIAALLLCACSRKEYEEITFSSWGSVTEVQILKDIIKEFEQQNNGTKVNFIHIPQNYFQKIHLLFASQKAPDVIFINNLYLPVYASKLEDLSKKVTVNEFYPQSIQALTVDGKLYAIPRDISTLVFYRNKSLINKTPQNLDELIKIISDVKPYGISYERDIYFALPYILTFNENIYNPDKSIVFYKSLEGKYAPAPYQVGSSTLAQMFMDGKIGLYLSGRWMYPKIKERASFDWDVITFPGTVPLDASGWAVSRDSKHKKAALEFVKFLSSSQSSRYFTSTGLIVPARIDTAKNLDNKVFLDAIDKSKVIQIDKNYRKITDKMNKELFK